MNVSLSSRDIPLLLDPSGSRLISGAAREKNRGKAISQQGALFMTN